GVADNGIKMAWLPRGAHTSPRFRRLKLPLSGTIGSGEPRGRLERRAGGRPTAPGTDHSGRSCRKSFPRRTPTTSPEHSSHQLGIRLRHWHLFKSLKHVPARLPRFGQFPQNEVGEAFPWSFEPF